MTGLADLSFFESMFPLPMMRLPIRTTVVRLASGSVVVSPIPGLSRQPGAAELAQCASEIVAPSAWHHLGIPEAVSFMPRARLWGVPGVDKKQPDVWWKNVLTPETWPYNDELKCIALDGIPRLNEVLFIHRRSQTLIATDLCFNLLDAAGPGAWVMLHIFGTWRRFGISRLFLRYVTDRGAFSRSLARVLDEDIENIVMGHGHIVIGGAKSKLRAAMLERDLLA